MLYAAVATSSQIQREYQWEVVTTLALVIIRSSVEVPTMCLSCLLAVRIYNLYIEYELCEMDCELNTNTNTEGSCDDPLPWDNCNMVVPIM